MSAYRTPAEVPHVLEPPRGLVRTRGCRCTPPWFFWRLWHGVAVGDRWYCQHGRAWIFESSFAADGAWDELPPGE